MSRRKKSKAGRPPSRGATASDVVRVRVTPAEREAWERAAGETTLSAWIRTLANGAALK